MGSTRKTAQRPASASHSSGVPSLTSPALFMNLTPPGTPLGNARSTGRASSLDNSTIRTRSMRLPRCSVASPAARAVGGHTRPREAFYDVAIAVDGHRRDRRQPRFAGLAAGHGQHHRAFRSEPQSQPRYPDDDPVDRLRRRPKPPRRFDVLAVGHIDPTPQTLDAGPLNAVPNPSRRFRGSGWDGTAISDT